MHECRTVGVLFRNTPNGILGGGTRRQAAWCELSCLAELAQPRVA